VKITKSKLRQSVKEALKKALHKEKLDEKHIVEVLPGVRTVQDDPGVAPASWKLSAEEKLGREQVRKQMETAAILKALEAETEEKWDAARKGDPAKHLPLPSARALGEEPPYPGDEDEVPIVELRLMQSISEELKKALNEKVKKKFHPRDCKIDPCMKEGAYDGPGCKELKKYCKDLKKNKKKMTNEELDAPRMKDAPPGNPWDNPFRIPPEERTGKPMEPSSGPPHIQGIRVMQNEYDKWVEAAKKLPDEPRNDIRGFERRTIDAFINTVNDWRKQRGEEPSFSCSDVGAEAEQPEEQPIEEGLRRKKIKINLTRGEG